MSHGGTVVGKEGELWLAFFITSRVSHGGTSLNDVIRKMVYWLRYEERREKRGTVACCPTVGQ